MGIDLHPRGTAIAALLDDGTLAVYDAATGDVRDMAGCRAGRYPADVAWSPDVARIAVQCSGPCRGEPILVLEVESGEVHEVPSSTGGAGTGPYLGWSSDGQAILLTRLDVCSSILEVASGKVQMTLGEGHSCYDPYAIAWSPDGRSIAALTRNPAGRLDLLDARTGRVLRTLGEVRGMPGSLSVLAAWASDDELLTAEAQHYTRPTRWNVRSGASIVGQGKDLGGNAYAPGGACYATDDLLCCANRGVELREWETGQVLHFARYEEEFWHITWSPDGGRLAALAQDGTIVVWKAEGEPCVPK